MVVEQWNRRVHQKGAPLGPDRLKDLGEGAVTFLKIASVDAADRQTVKSTGVLGGVLSAGLGGVGRDVPAVVLYQIYDRELPQGGHLKGLGDLAFRHAGIAERADDDRQIFRVAVGRVVGQLLSFAVLQSQRDAGGGDGLHACGAALMRNGGTVLVF